MRTACLFLTTAILGGCVGSIESKEAKVKLAELTSGELDTLCEWIEETADRKVAEANKASKRNRTDFATAMCTQAAVDTAKDEFECSVYRDDCINALPESGVYHPGELCAKKKKKTVPKQCTATVQQLKACFEARQDEIISAAGAALCWDMVNSRLTGSKLVSCTNVLPACVGFFAKHASYEVESTTPVRDDSDWDDDGWGDDFGTDDEGYPSDDEAADDEATDEGDPTEEPPAEEAPADDARTGRESTTSHMDGGTHGDGGTH